MEDVKHRKGPKTACMEIVGVKFYEYRKWNISSW